MPIFNVYRINENHLARVRTQRANTVLGDWNTNPFAPNPFRLSFEEWKIYLKETISKKHLKSQLPITIKHVLDHETI